MEIMYRDIVKIFTFKVTISSPWLNLKKVLLLIRNTLITIEKSNRQYIESCLPLQTVEDEPNDEKRSQYNKGIM